MLFRFYSGTSSLGFVLGGVPQCLFGIMLHVVNDFKLNLDFLCSDGNQAAAEHVQLLKIRAHLLMICKVCCFYCFSPRVYCVHVRDYFSVVFVNEA